MNSDYRGEIRGILLVSLFILVVPLILFPRDLGLKLNWSPLLIFAAELVWYMLVLFVVFSRASAPRVLGFALVTLSCRIGLGIGFGILLLVMFSPPLSSALRLGIYQYGPAFLLQAVMCPFVLRPLFETSLRRTGMVKSPISESGGTKELPREGTGFAHASVAPARREEKSDDPRPISSQKETPVKGKSDLENVLGYLREYTGVKAAVLVDADGLVVEKNSTPDYDPEMLASFALSLKETNDKTLRRMGGGASERIGIHTPALWINLNQIGKFTLVVLSDRHTDELLGVRILQSTAMIRKILADRYKVSALKVVEA